jgi:hypothetical protein
MLEEAKGRTGVDSSVMGPTHRLYQTSAMEAFEAGARQRIASVSIMPRPI